MPAVATGAYKGWGRNTSRGGSMLMRMSTTALSLPAGYHRDGGSGALPRARVRSEGHTPQPGKGGSLSPEGARAHQHRLMTSLAVISSHYISFTTSDKFEGGYRKVT